MAFQSGSTSSVANVLASLRLFAISQGWTSDYNGGGWTHMTHGTTGQSVGWNLSGSDLSVVGVLGYDSGESWNTQPDNSHVMYCDVGDLYGTVNYWFFSPVVGSLYLVMRANNEFRHVLIGTLEKAGAYTGGDFAAVTFWSGSSTPGDPWAPDVMVPFDGHPNTRSWPSAVVHVEEGAASWASVIGSANLRLGDLQAYGNIRGGYGWIKFDASPNLINGAAILLPINPFAEVVTGYRTPLGGVPGARALNMFGIAVGDSILLGTDVWRIFPIVSYSLAPSSDPYAPKSSGTMAMAYLEV